MIAKYGSLLVTYPPWVDERVNWHERVATDEDKMSLVLALVVEHRRRGAIGPFAAAIFQRNENRLVSIGLSSVVELKSPVAHAPILALAKAGEVEDTHDLSSDPKRSYEIFLNCEPCRGCAQFILSSGISRIVYGAPGKVKERLGMEHGPQPLDHLRKCGIEIVSGVLASEAKRLIEDYGRGDQTYNERRD